MKTLKNVGLFAAGFLAAMAVDAWVERDRAEHPYEGSTVYENDEFKVIRRLPTKHDDIDSAIIVYKNKDQ